MSFSRKEKESIKLRVRNRLSEESEIYKIVLFGSFVTSNSPNDLDIAIYQNSNENYLNLSMRYRKILRDINLSLPCDIIPLRSNPKGLFLDEINSGEIIYER